jgi:Bacterial Ig-like domain
MIQALKYLQLTASTLAACLVISACGGGAAEAPPSNTPNNSMPSGNSPTTSTPGGNSPTTSTPSGTSPTVVVDTAPPTLTITDSVTAATATGPVTFTFTFSEDVGTSFTSADVVVTGATAGTLTKVDATHYTMLATPPANSTGTINVNVSVGTFNDLASNLNTAAAAGSQGFNTVPSGSTGTCLPANCIDFSGTITFGLFENVTGTVAIANDPKDPTNKVAKFIKTASDKEYFGTTIIGGPASVVLTSANKTVTMRVLSPSISTNMLLKFEGGAGGATTEIDVATTKANEWETLSFGLPATGTFTTVVLFPNGRSTVTANKEIYVDEIKFPVVAVVTPPVVVTTPLKWASGYAAGKSVEGGDFGNFKDDAAPLAYAFGDVSPLDAADPNFYFGFGFNDLAKKANYMGAFVKAPGNGNVNLGAYTTLNFFSWGNVEWMNLAPTFTVILQGAPKAGCGSNSGASEVKLTFVSNSKDPKSYALPLSSATVNFACNGETTAAAILTAGISQFNIIADGSANINFTTRDATSWPSVMNVGKITFN